MTERDAVAKGYCFTGHYIGNFRSGAYKGIPYDYGKDGCKIIVADLKKRGIKSVVVPNKADKYSRGQNTGITGYSVYAEPKYGILERLDEVSAKVDSQKERMEKLIQKQKQELEDLKFEFVKENKYKEELEQKLVEYKF